MTPALDVRRRLNDPLRLAIALGLTKGMKRQPRGVLVCCPVHDDREASCSVRVADDDTIACKCFSCGWSADALGLIAVVERLDLDRDFAKVMERGAELAGMSLEDAGKANRERTGAPPSRPEPPPRPVDVDTFDRVVRVLATIGRLDGRSFSAEPTAYLERRGLLAAAREAGWFAVRPGHQKMLIDVFGAELLQRADLVDSRGDLRHSANVVAIPWRDRSGRVTTIQRRRLDDGKPKYVFGTNLPPLEPYGAEELSRASATAEIVVVEGAVDVLARRALEGNSGRVVIGVPGVDGWKPFDWARIASGRTVLLAFDADEHGDRGAARLGAELFEAGADRVLRSKPEGAHDWADALGKAAAC